MTDLEQDYKDLVAGLPALVEKSWSTLPAAEGQDLDRIADLHDKGWLYVYAVLIHRIRKHGLTKKILEHAAGKGFTVENQRDYDIDEDGFAYSLVGRSQRMSRADLLAALESMCCVMLRKEGQKKCVPLLKVEFDENAFDAAIVPFSKIKQSLDNV